METAALVATGVCFGLYGNIIEHSITRRLLDDPQGAFRQSINRDLNYFQQLVMIDQQELRRAQNGIEGQEPIRPNVLVENLERSQNSFIILQNVINGQLTSNQIVSENLTIQKRLLIFAHYGLLGAAIFNITKDHSNPIYFLFDSLIVLNFGISMINPATPREHRVIAVGGARPDRTGIRILLQSSERFKTFLKLSIIAEASLAPFLLAKFLFK